MLSERIEKWPNEFKAEGRDEGRAEGKAEVLVNLYMKKFGFISEDTLDRIQNTFFILNLGGLNDNALSVSI